MSNPPMNLGDVKAVAKEVLSEFGLGNEQAAQRLKMPPGVFNNTQPRMAPGFNIPGIGGDPNPNTACPMGCAVENTKGKRTSSQMRPSIPETKRATLTIAAGGSLFAAVKAVLTDDFNKWLYGKGKLKGDIRNLNAKKVRICLDAIAGEGEDDFAPDRDLSIMVEKYLNSMLSLEGLYDSGQDHVFLAPISLVDFNQRWLALEKDQIHPVGEDFLFRLAYPGKGRLENEDEVDIKLTNATIVHLSIKVEAVFETPKA